jgi:AcrR family transcriptional regulator
VVDQRRYAALFAKGEDRRQRILTVAQRLVARNGGRGTTLSQIARAAGVSTAGLLHHFESKEQLLNAVLDARDADDLSHVDITADFIEQFEAATTRFGRSHELAGMFTVLQAENLDPDAPLHDRFLDRYRDAVAIVTESIRRGQQTGRYRADLDPAIKAMEIIAFLFGMETSWLLDPSIPLTAVFREYTRSLASQLAPSLPPGIRSGRG